MTCLLCSHSQTGIIIKSKEKIRVTCKCTKTKYVIVDVFSLFSCLGYFATTTIATYIGSNGRYAMFEYSLIYVACSSYLFSIEARLQKNIKLKGIRL